MNPLSTGRRRVLALSAAVTGAILPLLLIFPSSPPQEVEASVIPVAAPAAAPSRDPMQRRRFSASRSPIERSDLAPRTPHEEAMLAAITHSGEGFVRCALPNGMTPDLDALNWAGIRGTTLTMATEEPTGSIPLMHADVPPPPQLDVELILTESVGDAELEQARQDREAWAEEYRWPVAIAEWADAGPGQEGRCTVRTRDELVQVQVRVIDDRGKPLPNAMLTAYGPSVRADDQGRASVRLWPGPQSTLSGYADVWDDGGESGLPSVRSLFGAAALQRGGREPLELVLRDRQLELDGVVGVDSTGFLDEAEARLEDHDAYILAALREPGLSMPAKAQLTYWLDRSQGDADILYAAFGE